MGGEDEKFVKLKRSYSAGSQSGGSEAGCTVKYSKSPDRKTRDITTDRDTSQNTSANTSVKKKKKFISKNDRLAGQKRTQVGPPQKSQSHEQPAPTAKRPKPAKPAAVDAPAQKAHAEQHRNTARPTAAYEYNLVDATPEERTLILEGGVVDRINCLSLLCARNPSTENYKQLLFYAQNQRNDVIYLVLKNLRDLVKAKPAASPFIRTRIVRAFEKGAQNQYIKDKALEIVGVLIRAGVYEEELTLLLVDRLMEKGSTFRTVEKELRSVFFRNEQLLAENIEDSYYKNDNFRVQNNILKFLSGVELVSSAGLFAFYDQALCSVDEEYSAEQKDILINLILTGLNKTAYDGCSVSRVELVRTYVSTPRTIVSSLSLLYRIGDPFVESFALKAAKSNLLRNTKYEAEFLNAVAGRGSPSLISKLLGSCFFASVPYIIGILMLAAEKLPPAQSSPAAFIFIRHYHPVVRDVSLRLLRSMSISKYDPFDPVALRTMTDLLNRE